MKRCDYCNKAVARTYILGLWKTDKPFDSLEGHNSSRAFIFDLCKEHEKLIVRELSLLMREYLLDDLHQKSFKDWFTSWNVEKPTKIKVSSKKRKKLCYSKGMMTRLKKE